MIEMYKHKNKGEGTISITDDNGKYITFFPGDIISLDKRYTRFESYNIFCIDAEQIVIDEQKPKTKKKPKEMIEDDSTND